MALIDQSPEIEAGILVPDELVGCSMVYGFARENRDRIRQALHSIRATQVTVDRIVTDDLLGARTEHDAPTAADIHDRKRGLLKSVLHPLSADLAEFLPAEQQVRLPSMTVSAELGLTVMRESDTTVVFGDYEFTQPQIDSGYRRASEEQWTGLVYDLYMIR